MTLESQQVPVPGNPYLKEIPYRMFKGQSLKGSVKGVTKRCRLSWLTNRVQMRGEGGGVANSSQWVLLCIWSPNKLWRSNSIGYLTNGVSQTNLLQPPCPLLYTAAAFQRCGVERRSSVLSSLGSPIWNLKYDYLLAVRHECQYLGSSVADLDSLSQDPEPDILLIRLRANLLYSWENFR